MGVYINGMEMPTSCDECRFMVFEDTNCAPELYCGCPIVFKAHPQGAGHRPDYCPLVPLPEHGRLIDGDALYEVVKKRTRNWAGGWNDIECVLTGNDIKNAPTVIKTEEDTDIQKEFIQNWHEEDEW